MRQATRIHRLEPDHSLPVHISQWSSGDMRYHYGEYHRDERQERERFAATTSRATSVVCGPWRPEALGNIFR
jgi:hypothetical protein